MGSLHYKRLDVDRLGIRNKVSPYLDIIILRTVPTGPLWFNAGCVQESKGVYSVII